MKSLVVLFFLSGFISAATAQSIALDPSFGRNGIQITGTNGTTHAAKSVKVLPLSNGGFYIVYNDIKDNNTRVAKYLGSGTLDLYYGNSGFSLPLSIQSYDAVLQDDKVVVAGAFISMSAFGIGRLNSDGFIDSTFGTYGIQHTTFRRLSSSRVKSVAVDNNNKIVVAGDVYNIDNSGHEYNSDIAVARFNYDGTPDNTFDHDGKFTNTTASSEDKAGAVAVAGGKIIAAGSFGNNFGLLRFNNDGSFDNTFSDNGIQTTKFDANGSVSSRIYALAIEGDKIVAAGSANKDVAIARYKNDGSLDGSFSADGEVITHFDNTDSVFANAMVIQGNKIIINCASNSGFTLARYNDDGSLDQSFDGDGKLVTAFNNYDSVKGVSAAIQGSKILTVGNAYFHDTSVVKNDYAVVRFNTNGTPDSTLSADGKLTGSSPINGIEFFTSVIQDDGKIVVAGSVYVGQNILLIVRYNKNGSLDSTFSEDGIETAYFEPNGRTYLLTIALQGNKIVVAGKTTISNIYEVLFLRYNENGSPDSTFGNGGRVITDFGSSQNEVYALAIQGDKIVVAGQTVNKAFIARYNYDGSFDNTFGRDGIAIRADSDDGYTSALAIQGDKIIFANNTQHDSSGYNEKLVLQRFNSDGSPDNTFNNNGKVISDFGTSLNPSTIVIKDNKIVVLNRGGSDGYHKIVMARYNLNGTLDNTFNDSGSLIIDLGFTYPFYSRDVNYDTSTGKIFFTGTTPVFHGKTLFVFKRFKQNGTFDSSFATNGNQELLVNRFLEPQRSILYKDHLYMVGSVYQDQDNRRGLIASFKLGSDTTPPPPVSIICPASQSVSTDFGVCYAKVNSIDPVVSPSGFSAVTYTLQGATTGTGTGSISGKNFSKGVTNVTYKLAGDISKTCQFSVTVTPRPEVCNGVDDDCDGLIDEDCSELKLTVADVTVYESQGQAKLTVNLSRKSDSTINFGYGTVDATAKQPGDYTKVVSAGTIAKGSTSATVSIKVSKDNIKEQPEYFKVDFYILYSKSDIRYSTTAKVNILDGAPAQRNLYDNAEDSQDPLNITLKAYPNPSSNAFNLQITSPLAGKVTVKVMDARSQVLETREVNANTIFQTGSNYFPGIYFAEVTQGDKKKIVKLIKQ